MKLDLTVEELRELCSGSVCLVCASKREIVAVAEPPKEDCQQERQHEPRPTEREPRPTDIVSVVVGDPADFFSVGTLPRVYIYTRDGAVILTYGEIREDTIYLRSHHLNTEGRILFNPVRYEDWIHAITYPIEADIGGFGPLSAVYFLIEDSRFSAGTRGKANLTVGRRVFYGIPFVCDELGSIHFESKNPFEPFVGVLSQVRRAATYWNSSTFAATFSHTLGLCAPYDVSVVFVEKLDVPLNRTAPSLAPTPFEEVPEYLQGKAGLDAAAPVFVSDPPVVVEVLYINSEGMQCKIGRDTDFFPAKREQSKAFEEKSFVGQRYSISLAGSDLVLRPLRESCTERYGRAVSSHWAFKKIVKVVIDGQNESCVLTNSDGTQFNFNPKFKPAMRGTRNAIYFSRYLDNGALEFSVDSDVCWPYNGTIVATPDSDFAYFNSPYIDDYRIKVEFKSLPDSEENRLRILEVAGGPDACIFFEIGIGEKGCFTAELSTEGTLRGDGWELVWDWANGPGRWVLKAGGKEDRIVHCDHRALSKIQRINIWKDRKRCTVFDSNDASFMMQIEALGHDALFYVGNKEKKDWYWPLSGTLRQDASFGHWYFKSDYRNCNERGGGEYPIRVTFD